MALVKAAFTLSGKVSAERIKQAAYDAGEDLDIPVEQVRAGAADGWCVLSARLGEVTTDQAHYWLIMAVSIIERDEYAEVFRLEIDGEIRPLKA